MQVVIGDVIHEVGFYDGLYVDLACGERVFGEWGREYEIVFDREVTCEVCRVRATGKEINNG